MPANPIMTTNPIAARVERIKRGDDPQLLARMPSGYAVLANQQPLALPGCCMLLPDPTPPTLNAMAPADRARFLADLALIGDAVLAATGAEHVNYLILCNQVPALHGHCVPRYAAEDPALRLMDPFAAYDFPLAPRADVLGPHAQLHANLRRELTARLG